MARVSGSAGESVAEALVAGGQTTLPPTTNLIQFTTRLPAAAADDTCRRSQSGFDCPNCPESVSRAD